jgi:alkylation response protein AidB-like acyl-CoA dehydrogenase
VPVENLIGQRGAGLRQFFHMLDIGRIGVAAMGVGLAQGALDQALSYAKERRAFGQPIAKFQSIQAKLKSGRLAVQAADQAVQIHGGYGYIEEYPVCRFYRDAKILTIGEGTDEVQEMVIARALGA